VRLKGARLLHAHDAVRPPKVILMAGVAAAGKTSLARLLTEAANHPQLRRDSTLVCAMASKVPHLLELTVAEEPKDAGRTYLKSIAAEFQQLPANKPASLFIFFDECQAGRLLYFNKLRSFLTNGFISLPQPAQKAHKQQRETFAPPPLCDVTLVFAMNPNPGQEECITSEMVASWPSATQVERESREALVRQSYLETCFGNDAAWESRLSVATVMLFAPPTPAQRAVTVSKFIHLRERYLQRTHPAVQLDRATIAPFLEDELLEASTDRCARAIRALHPAPVLLSAVPADGNRGDWQVEFRATALEETDLQRQAREQAQQARASELRELPAADALDGAAAGEQQDVVSAGSTSDSAEESDGDSDAMHDAPAAAPAAARRRRSAAAARKSRQAPVKLTAEEADQLLAAAVRHHATDHAENGQAGVPLETIQQLYTELEKLRDAKPARAVEPGMDPQQQLRETLVRQLEGAHSSQHKLGVTQILIWAKMGVVFGRMQAEVWPAIKAQEGSKRKLNFNDYIARMYNTNDCYVSQYKKLAAMVATCPQLPYMVLEQREWTKTQLLTPLSVIAAAIHRRATAQRTV
jgi:hypothetical protein